MCRPWSGSPVRGTSVSEVGDSVVLLPALAPGHVFGVVVEMRLGYVRARKDALLLTILRKNYGSMARSISGLHLPHA